MAKNYKKISGNIEKLIIDNPTTPKEYLTWINIKNARKKEIEYLRKKYNFNLSHLQLSSVKASSQRPSIEKMDDYIFLILHFPILDKNHITVSEIEFFIGDGYLITLHNDNIPAIKEFFKLCQKDSESSLSFLFESSAVLLYEILEKLMSGTYNLLDEVSVKIYELEELIFSQNSKTAASQILYLRRNIIHMRKIMQNHKNIIKKLTDIEIGLAPEESVKKYYHQLLDHSKRIWENLENQRDMIEVLNSTNDAFLNYRISDIMKTLTIFSVIVFPLTLLAAIFGMNTVKGMPFIDTENGFWIIIVIMLTGCLGMLFFFERKKWL